MESGKRDGKKVETFSRKIRFRDMEEAGADPERSDHAGNTVSGITITAGSVGMSRSADQQIVK